MKYILILLTLSTLLLGLDKNDFSYVRDINTTATSGIVSMALPVEVIAKLKNYDLADIAVYDSNNRRMPHALMRQNAQEEQHQELTLPYTLVTNDKLENKTSLYIAMNDKTIALQETTKIQDQDYIVDASLMSNGIDHLLFTTDYDERFMVETDVWCSKDLSDWRLIADKEVLANIYMQEHLVNKNRINLHGVRCNFLKVHTQKPINIQNISGIKVLNKAQSRKTHRLEYESVDGGLEFHVARQMHVEKLHFSLPPKEQFYNFKLLTYNQYDKTWLLSRQITVYSLQKGKLKHLDVALGYDEKYRLEAIDGAYLPEDMNLSFSYLPTKLYYIAQGKAPYSLHYGALIQVPSSGYLDTILTLDQPSTKATLKDERVINTNVSVKEPTSNYSGVAVWLALILGVVVLSFMSLIVFKELNQDKKI